MRWGAYTSLFLLSTIKFMFAPLAGPNFDPALTFMETYVSCTSGAILSSAIFFFSARFFMDRYARKQLEKQQKAIAQGKEPKVNKKFTRLNKGIVRTKLSIGIVGVTFLAPLFLSIPGGSIIVSKFYSNSKIAYPLVVTGILCNGLIITLLAYFIF